MDESDALKAVSEECLRGRPVPQALRHLWEAELSDDSYVGADLELLESRKLLELGFGEEDAHLPGDVGANVQAHRRMFESLGFFAADADGGFLAYHLEFGDPENPPVVELNSEGQYRWLGACLGEALLALAGETGNEDKAKAWLKARDIGTTAPLGVSVGALPDLGALHRKLYDACRGKAAVVPTALKSSAQVSGDPLTWIGAPGSKVESVLKKLLSVKEKSRLGNWMSTDEKGRVKTVWLTRTPATESLEVKSAKFGMSRAHVIETLGQPSKEGVQWVRYDAPRPSLHLEFKDGAVIRMTLMSAPP
jgi:hypothetical protein